MSAAGVPHPLPPELVRLVAERMALFGDETRVRILDELRGGERNVQSIADALPTTQQNVSGHLRLLRTAGVVARRVCGREAYYVVADHTVFEVWERVIAGLHAR